MAQRITRRSFFGLAGFAGAMVATAGLGLEGAGLAAASDGELHEITDPDGNKGMIPSDIQSCVIDQVPLASTYVMYKGGTAEGLIGLSGSVYKVIQQTLLPKIAPDILDVDTSYYTDGDLNIEQLLTLHPDIVLYNFGNSKHRTLFDQAGLYSFGFSTSGNPAVLYADWLRGLEQVFEEPGKMDEVIAWGQDLIDLVKERTSKVADEDRRRVMCLFNVSQGTPRVSGGDHGKGGNLFGHNWMKTVNVVNVAEEDVSGVDSVSMEMLYGWQPEIVFLTGKGQAGCTVSEVLGNAVDGCDFEPLAAVQEGRVYSSNLGMWSWMTPNPDAPLVVLWMASICYPELFEDVDLREKTREYYKLGYNYDLTDEEIDGIYEDSHIVK